MRMVAVRRDQDPTSMHVQHTGPARCILINIGTPDRIGCKDYMHARSQYKVCGSKEMYE